MMIGNFNEVQMNTFLTVPVSIVPGNVKIRMAGTVDQPLWCLADVCKVLGIGNPSMVAQRLDDDEKSTISNTEGAGGPPRIYVNESGLYTTVMMSRKPEAKSFRKWVTGEVLPCIRKHGQYPAPEEDMIGRYAWDERLSQSFKEHNHHIHTHFGVGYFSALTGAIGEIMVLKENIYKHALPMKCSDLPDGSIGKMYRAYRRSIGLPDLVAKAPLYIPGSNMTVPVCVYPPEELLIFKKWLIEIYIPYHCHKYLDKKFRSKFGRLPPASAANANCKEVSFRTANLRPGIAIRILRAGGIIRADATRLLN